MEIRKDGYAEARGGMEELKPLGGTATDMISAGGYSCIHQVNTSLGWVRTHDESLGATNFSSNLQLSEAGYAPFQSGIVDDALYMGADSDFSRIQAFISRVATFVTLTIAYEYSTNAAGTTWGTLTTSETINWATTGLQYASWKAPTDWVAATIGNSTTGNVLKKWIRLRITAVNTLTQAPLVYSMFGLWAGMRELYGFSTNPRHASGALAGTFERHGQTGTVEEWREVYSNVFSGSAQPTRAASYRGTLYFVNGRDKARYSGTTLTGLGTLQLVTATPVAVAGAGISDGVYWYYAAWGEGQTQNTSLLHPLDAQSLYGVGQANFLGEVTLGGGNNQVQVTVGGSLSTGSGAVYFYRTQDLTAVPADQRGTFPAFLVDSIRRTTNSSSPAVLEGGAVWTDANPQPLFGNFEAVLYDNRPPDGIKYLTVYQNRLVVGTDDTWYWSEPFKPDLFNKAFNFIALNRSSGGRNMGCIEFGDQVVLFTEDQTWGLTNIDMDIPQLYPIHPAVGCVASDAIAVGDGVLIWPAKDGFYMWDGRGKPERISDSMEQTFGTMSYETHGGSRATIHNGRYDIRISNPDYSTIGSAYRFSLEAFEAKLHPWNTILQVGFASTLFPLATIHAPLGNNDAGKIHPIWGKVDYGTGAGEYGLFLGELTTQDAGSNYSCSATMHFPLPPNRLLSSARLLAYYQAANGWGTPALAFTPTTFIGSSPGTLNTGTPDTGDDYSLIGGTFSSAPRGTSDIQISFTVSSAAAGTVGQQRFFGAVLEGNPAGIRRGMV